MLELLTRYISFLLQIADSISTNRRWKELIEHLKNIQATLDNINKESLTEIDKPNKSKEHEKKSILLKKPDYINEYESKLTSLFIIISIWFFCVIIPSLTTYIFFRSFQFGYFFGSLLGFILHLKFIIQNKKTFNEIRITNILLSSTIMLFCLLIFSSYNDNFGFFYFLREDLYINIDDWFGYRSRSLLYYYLGSNLSLQIISVVFLILSFFLGPCLFYLSNNLIKSNISLTLSLWCLLLGLTTIAHFRIYQRDYYEVSTGVIWGSLISIIIMCFFYTEKKSFLTMFAKIFTITNIVVWLILLVSAILSKYIIEF